MHALYLWLTLRNLVHGCQLALADIWATSAPLSSLVWTYLALHATKQQLRAFLSLLPSTPMLGRKL